MRHMVRFYNPWAELEQFQREVDHAFRGALHRRHTEDVPTNVWVKDDEVRVTALLPGVPASSLEIEVHGNELVIRGAHTDVSLDSLGEAQRRERATGTFCRRVALPFAVDAQQVHATSKQGALEVRLPRAAADKPRRIEVHAA